MARIMESPAQENPSQLIQLLYIGHPRGSCGFRELNEMQLAFGYHEL